MGTIEFPRAKTCPQNKIESIVIYYLGKFIKSLVHEGNPAFITFDIPRDTDLSPNTIYLVITEKPQRVAKKANGRVAINNTTDHWKVADGHNALFFELALKQKKEELNPELDQSLLEKQEPHEPIYEWTYRKKELPANKRIPDDAIIIVYNPDLVEGLRGGDQIQLPTIVIKQCIDTDLENLHLRLQMESLDARAFHAPDKQVMTHHKDRESTLLILPIT